MYSLARTVSWCVIPWLLLSLVAFGSDGKEQSARLILAGFAQTDITPEVPIRLAGYAGRKRPADRIDQRLVAQALAFKTAGDGTFVLVTVDNCELSSAFLEPVLRKLETVVNPAVQGARGRVAVVSSHTHSAPVLADTLVAMPRPSDPDEQRAIQTYSDSLREKLVKLVTDAVARFEPVTLEHGIGHAGFAMNRRVYRGEKVVFGDNPDGPADRNVPVLRVAGTNGATRAVLFGYACHGTSVRDGDDWYSVSGDYMAYAREAIERVLPGAMAMYVPGFGADIDPSPRGPLLRAKQHGVELAGAVLGVLNRPMRPVRGEPRLAYQEVPLQLSDPPEKAQLERDQASSDVSVRSRAALYLARLEKGEALPREIKLPAGVLRFDEDLTMVLLGGEVVVDYSRRLGRLLQAEHPWFVAYAYDVPCYIPSHRIIREGGYESDFSLVYYGIYGPFRASIEDTLVEQVTAMVKGLR
jgi:hypothetical protein